MEVLRDFVQSVFSVVTVVVIQVVEVLKISSLIGYYIVTCIQECVAFICSAISVTCGVLKILCEDLLVFLQDVAQKFALFSETSGVVLSYFLITLIHACAFFKELFVEFCCLPISLCMFVISTISTCMLYVVTIAELLKRGIIFIGTGLWLLLWNVPSLLLYALSYVPHILVSIQRFICKSIVNSFYFVFNTICNNFIQISNFFTDIPCQAFAGLSIGLFMIWLVYTERHILIMYAIRAYQFELTILGKIFSVLRLPFRQLQRHILRLMSNENGDAVNTQDGYEYNFSSCSSSFSGDSKDLIRLQKTLEKELEERLCNVCKERRKSVIVLPCRHLCMCEECVSVVERISRICPLCRCYITRTLNVYM